MGTPGAGATNLPAAGLMDSAEVATDCAIRTALSAAAAADSFSYFRTALNSDTRLSMLGER